MPVLEIESLESLLVGKQLATSADLARVRSEPGVVDGQTLLDQLERRQVLTALQVDRIRRGDVDGLVLGGVKLLYKNASGSFARVFRGVSLQDGRVIGVKVLRDRWAEDPETVRLFHREGDLGRRLKHPNIVPIFETGSEGRHHYITMEFVEGGNLRDFIKIRGKLSPEETCKYGLHMARGLQYAIGQGVTHRDLKLTNVLMSSQGVAKLIDFGLGGDDAHLPPSKQGEHAQALEYTTLERGSNAPRNDPRSDLFFLGTILYELLTGEAPYPRTRDREERKRFGRYRDIAPLTAVAPDLPWNVSQIVGQLLQTNPDRRQQSAGEVCVQFEQVLRELGHAVEPVGGNRTPSTQPTVLCVEHRQKRQDILRDYFSKHGWRVLILTDLDRALGRLNSTPPDCLMLFGEGSGDQVSESYLEAVNKAGQNGVGVVLILTESQAALKDELANASAHGRVLLQPVSLRDIRVSLEELREQGGQ